MAPLPIPAPLAARPRAFEVPACGRAQQVAQREAPREAPRDWLSQHAANISVSSKEVKPGTAPGKPAAVSVSKRAACGKRRMAELDEQLQEHAVLSAQQLRPATAEELSWVSRTPAPLAFLWHFSDGSTSARPKPPLANARFNPRGDVSIVGCSILACSGGSSGGVADVACVQPTPPPAPPAGERGCGLSSDRSFHWTVSPCLSRPHVPLQTPLANRSKKTLTDPMPSPQTGPLLKPSQRCTQPLWSTTSRVAALGGNGGVCLDRELALPAHDGSQALRFGERSHGSSNDASAPMATLEVVRDLLLGRRGVCSCLIVPNAKLVLRALELSFEDGAVDDVKDDANGMAPSAWPGLERWVDPILLGWLVDPDATEHALLLPSLYRTFLGASMPSSTPPVLAVQSSTAMSALAAESAGDLLDAQTELRAAFELSGRMSATLCRLMHPGAIQSVLRRELRVASMLASMELCGMGIDPAALHQHTEATRRQLDALTKRAEACVKGPINLASPQQVSEALYVQIGLPKPGAADAARRAGNGSTSEVHLKELAERFPGCPLPALVLEHRELSKLSSTFLEPYAARAVFRDDGDGSQLTAPSSGVLGSAPPRSGPRLHTSWMGFSTGTGRLSSRNPNVQQVPKHSTALVDGNAGSTQHISIRGAFVAQPGMLLLSADYSQVRPYAMHLAFTHAAPLPDRMFRTMFAPQLEMRLMAHMSQDPRLQRELHAGGDLFRRVAAACASPSNLDATWHRFLGPQSHPLRTPRGLKGTGKRLALPGYHVWPSRGGRFFHKPVDSVSSTEREQTKQFCYGLTCTLAAAAACPLAFAALPWVVHRVSTTFSCTPAHGLRDSCSCRWLGC